MDSGEAVTVQSVAPVTSTGRSAAVLSAHRKERLPNGCRYGLTLTNNLTFPITDIGFRFIAHRDDGTVFQGITRSFYGVLPTQQLYREVTFNVPCEEIDYIEVTDPGHCIVGELTRRSAEPGDCIRLVDVPPGPLVRLVKNPTD
jgi:hypothetical protein